MPKGDFFISFLSVWKRRHGGGEKERGHVRETQRESMFAGLCNCGDLIGGERKTISLSRSSVLGNRKGGLGKKR